MSVGRGRALVRVALIVGSALLLVRGLPGLLGVAAARVERTRERVKSAAEAAGLADQAAVLEDSLRAALATLLTAAPLLGEGRTDPEAAAALQALLEGRATGSGLRVVSASPSPDSGAGVVPHVAIHVELEGDARGVARFLQSIEGGMPLLTIRDLVLSAGDPVSNTGPEILRLELTVRGWYVPRAAS